MSRGRRGADAGFTLIETLMALVIMSTAVVVLVGALAEVINQSQFHRGNAVAETVTRNYTQAVQAQVNYSSPLAVAVTPASSTITVQDGSGFAGTGYVSVDREAMKVTARVGNVLTVARGASIPADPASVVGHAVAAVVVPIYRCPTAAQLAPDVGAYPRPAGVAVTIDKVEYWNPAAVTPQFVSDTSSASCGSTYDAACTYTDTNDNPLVPDVRDQCDPGLYRLTITTSTGSSPGLKGVTASTQVLVRRGSS